MLKEKEQIKLKNGKGLEKGDVVYISMTPDNRDVIVKGRFVELTKTGNIKMYVIDPKYNLVDIEIKPSRIIKSEKPN